MEPKRWQKVEFYHAALERAESRREECSRESLRWDEALRREVESLLAYENPANAFMEAPSLGGRH
jgi:hypothetical protein